MGKKSREKWERRLGRARVQGTPQNNGIVAFLEHGWMLTIFGILGGAVALIWMPTISILGAIACGAFHRVKVVEGKSWKIQAPSYLLVFASIVGIAYGCIVRLRNAVHLPNQQFNNIYNTYTAPTSPVKAESPKDSRVPSLRERANLLANQSLDFLYAREGPINSWKQQAIAQAFLDSMRNQHTENQFQARLSDWNAKTGQQFVSFYWPQIQEITGELSSAGVDVSPISRAVASDNPRRVALMLSVVAERIGKKPPYARSLTPIEARAIVQGLGGAEMQIYGYKPDANSMLIAETLRKEFAKEKWKVNSAVLPLQRSETPLSGIHVVFPSADLTFNFEGMIEAFKACELETRVDTRPMKQPPTILKIEVWPQKETAIPIGPDLTR